MFDDNSYYFGAAAICLRRRRPAVLRRRGCRIIAWFLPDEPSSHAFTDAVLEPTSDQLGIDYPTVYYDAASPNWAVLAATAVSEGPDVSGSIAATDAQCAEMVGALRDAGYQGRILAASCVGLYEAIGDEAVGVDTDADHWHPGDVGVGPGRQARRAGGVRGGHAGRRPGGPGHRQRHHHLCRHDQPVAHHGHDRRTGRRRGGGEARCRATKDFDSFAGPKITLRPHGDRRATLPAAPACCSSRCRMTVRSKAITDDYVDVTGLLG